MGMKNKFSLWAVCVGMCEGASRHQDCISLLRKFLVQSPCVMRRAAGNAWSQASPRAKGDAEMPPSSWSMLSCLCALAYLELDRNLCLDHLCLAQSHWGTFQWIWQFPSDLETLPCKRTNHTRSAGGGQGQEIVLVAQTLSLLVAVLFMEQQVKLDVSGTCPVLCRCGQACVRPDLQSWLSTRETLFLCYTNNKLSSCNVVL